MKLRAVAVHNFRGIADATFLLSDYSLLVGPNNAGKSTIIDSIRAFYEKDSFKYRADKDFPFDKPEDGETWIELAFLLTAEEYESLAEHYKLPDNTLRVRKYLLAKSKERMGAIFGYKVDGTLSSEPFYGARNIQSGKFGDIVYIPAVSKVDEHAKLSGPSVLRDLVSNVLQDVVKSSESFQKFSNSFDTFSKGIKSEKTDDGRSLAGLESELNGLLGPWGAEFKLKMSTPTAAEIIKSMLGYDFFNPGHDQPQGAEQFGSGFQRHFIYSLIQVGARYASKKAAKKVKDFSPDMTLILFEEPEAFLHPAQQEILARSLMALAASPERQIICTTHSPHFVSKNTTNIPSIIRLKRTTKGTEVWQITNQDWAGLVDANQAIVEIASHYPKMAKRLADEDKLPEMEAVKHFLWLNPDRCSLFFANHVLLVEGATEVALINKMVGEGSIRNADCGLYVLDCLGKYNIHRFMNLLTRLGIPHSVIHDSDMDQDEHWELNQLIVSSSHKDLTLAIRAVPGNLEKMLGVPSAGAEHRKPQHMLYLHECGKIDPAKLAAFREMVEACLPIAREKASKAKVEDGIAAEPY